MPAVWGGGGWWLVPVYSCSGRLRFVHLEVDPLRLSPGVFVGQMSINLADQDATVLVPDPTSDRQVIDPRHDARANKEMAAVMEAKLWQLGLLAGEEQRLTERLGRPVLIASLRRWEQPFGVRGATPRHLFQMFLQLRVEIYYPGVVVLREPVRPDGELPILPVDIVPPQPQRLGHPG